MGVLPDFFGHVMNVILKNHTLQDLLPLKIALSLFSDQKMFLSFKEYFETRNNETSPTPSLMSWRCLVLQVAERKAWPRRQFEVLSVR